MDTSVYLIIIIIPYQIFSLLPIIPPLVRLAGLSGFKLLSKHRQSWCWDRGVVTRWMFVMT